MNIVVCVAGKNRIAIETLQMVRALNVTDVVAVCNQSDDGTDHWQPSYRRFAQDVGVEIIDLTQLYNIERLVFLSTEFDKIVRPDKFRSGCRLYNLHFSALPAYKGVFTSAHPILNGERESGCTLHEIDPGIDTGPMIDQTIFSIADDETAKSLYSKYLNHGRDLVRANLRNLLAGSIKATPQPVAGSSYFSRASINYSALAIDLRQTCERIIRQVRAYNYRPFQLPLVHGRLISAAYPESTATRKAPGTIVATDDSSIVITTIDYDCRLIFDRFEELLIAVEKDDLSALDRILTYDPWLIHESNNRGWTPLIVASYHNARKSIVRLIQLGADPNKPNEKGTTPLMYAKNAFLSTGDATAILRLIEAGASLCAKDLRGKTLYDYVTAPQRAIIEVLVRLRTH